MDDNICGGAGGEMLQGDGLQSKEKFGLNGNALKLIAIIAMTIDHLTWVFLPGYNTYWLAIVAHLIGRLTAPIMCFFIAEGFYHTRNIKKYAARLFLFAIVSHFAYNFCGGINFLPFKDGEFFNQTSVMWGLAWGLVALAVLCSNNPKLKIWLKILIVILICGITFPADWSCVSVLMIIGIGCNHGNFKKQMLWMMLAVCTYVVVYCVCVDLVYGFIMLGTAFSIPLLYLYNGQRGSWKGMKWFFYAYYPLHLVVCGLLRVFVMKG